MNKLLLMSQKSLRAVILFAVDREPGIASQRLYNLCKEWNSKLTGMEFDEMLGSMVNNELRVSNKCWFMPGAEVEKKLKSGSKDDPRQTRMFG
jgi:hypothetical protein